LLGHPVAHSVSPAIHEAALAACGLVGSYALCDVPDEAGLDAKCLALQRLEYQGFNVTLPHKLAAARRCTVLEGVAAELGVVNTLVPAAGGIAGHNTDVDGLVASIREGLPGAGERLAGRAALVLGAGGAAYAAVFAAFALGAGEVRIWNRTPARAREVAARLGPRVVCSDDPTAAAAGVGAILQAGSGGMGLVSGTAPYETLVTEASAVVAASAGDAWLVDLVYRPRETPWVRAAGLTGRAALDGLGMLVHQAALAFALWTGHTPPTAPLWHAAEAAVTRG
jgi:shikimate dehydrogenase